MAQNYTTADVLAAMATAQPQRPTWSWVPPAQSGYQVEGTGLLPFGRYQMPDGSQQVSFGLPQGLLDAYRSARYGLGFEQDPNAPAGYVSHDAMLKGAIGGAGAAMTGPIAGSAARAAVRAPQMFDSVVSAGGRPGKFTLDYYGTPVNLLQNPSRQRLEGFLNRTKYKAARRIVDEDTGDIYVWDAADPALHEMIAKQLGIKKHKGDVIGID
jgi:hypothetical protein